MIPDSLLFQMPLLPLGFSPSDFLFAFIVAAVSLLLGCMMYRAKKSPRLDISPIPDISDENFESALSLSLRERITREYYPYHATAHTVREIARYAPDHRYASILQEIEDSIYQSKPISPSRRKEILRQVKK